MRGGNEEFGSEILMSKAFVYSISWPYMRLVHHDWGNELESSARSGGGRPDTLHQYRCGKAIETRCHFQHVDEVMRIPEGWASRRLSVQDWKRGNGTVCSACSAASNCRRLPRHPVNAFARLRLVPTALHSPAPHTQAAIAGAEAHTLAHT
jgi:hypothetical protein